MNDTPFKRWCWYQVVDIDNSIVCVAHCAEDRVFDCPYKDYEDRLSREHPCQDFDPDFEFSTSLL